MNDIKVYNIYKDEFEPISQEWVNNAQEMFNLQRMRIQIINTISSMNMADKNQIQKLKEVRNILL